MPDSGLTGAEGSVLASRPMPRPMPVPPATLAAVERAVIACERCPRLRAWCERVAREKTVVSQTFC